MFQDVTAAVIELVLQDIPFITVRLISILGMLCYYNRLPSENENNLQCLQYMAIVIYNYPGCGTGPCSVQDKQTQMLLFCNLFQ